MRTRASKILLLDMGGVPPREVRLFPKGEFGTTKGKLRYTDRSEKLIREQWAKLNRDFGFDWGHSQFKPIPEEDKIAAGWGKLDFRPDGLYVVGIEWTARATERIASKEMRYLSPALDQKDGEITAVFNCALTNLPATHGAQPLVLSAVPPSASNRRLSTMSDKHTALAKGLHKNLSGLMASSKEGAESDHEGLKALCGKLSEALPEHFSALSSLMSDMGVEPDGDEGEGEDKEEGEAKKELTMLSDLAKEHAPGKDMASSIKEAFQVRAAVIAATGKDKGLVGAVMALSDTAKRAPKTDPAVQRAIDKGIKLRKIHPSDTARFLSQTVEDIESYIELGSTIDGPTSLVGGREVEGKAQIDGTAPAIDKEAQAAAEKRADEMWSRGR